MAITSTYMGFPVSTVGVSSGEDWETNLNAALAVIDAHDHSPGNGVQISPSGLNISSDLSFVGNNVFDLKSVIFEVQGSPLGNAGLYVGCLYVSGNELYYNDVSGGNQVQITLSGAVNATSSGISSGSATAAFSGGVLLVKSSSISYANIAVQSVLLSNSGNLSNQLTLKAPTLSGSYAVALPAIPGSTSFLTIDTSGNMASTIPTSLGIVGSNIANSTIGNTKFISGTQIPLQDTAKTANYTALVTDSLIDVDSTSGAFTISLYSAASNPGLQLSIYKTSNDFTAITVSDGSSFSTTLNTQNECLTLRATSSGWVILDRKIPSVWTSWSPSFVSFGTATSVRAYWQRIGNLLKFQIYWNSGTNTNVTSSISFPTGLNINNALMFVDLIGQGVSQGVVSTFSVTCDTSTNAHLMYFARPSATFFTKMTGNDFDSGAIQSIQGSVPISGWNG